MLKRILPILFFITALLPVLSRASSCAVVYEGASGNSQNLPPQEFVPYLPSVRLNSPPSHGGARYGAGILFELSDGRHVLAITNGVSLGHEAILEVVSGKYKQSSPNGIWWGELEIIHDPNGKGKITRANETSGTFSNGKTSHSMWKNSVTKFENVIQGFKPEVIAGAQLDTYQEGSEPHLNELLVSRHGFKNTLTVLLNIENVPDRIYLSIKDRLFQGLLGLEAEGVVSREERTAMEEKYNNLTSNKTPDETKPNLRKWISQQAAILNKRLDDLFKSADKYVEIIEIPASSKKSP